MTLFREMAERITAVLTDETRQAILKLKYETPDTAKIMGVEYYQAVIQDGVRTYAELEDWKKQTSSHRRYRMDSIRTLLTKP